MIRRRFRAAPLLLGMLVFGLLLGGMGVAAQDATPEASPGASPAAGADMMNQFGPVAANSAYRIAFLQVYPDKVFWQRVKDAVEARALEDGVTVDVIALPSASSVADQVSQVEDAITQGYDGIIMGTVDAAGIVPGVEAANAAGIPVIAIDTAPAGGELVSLAQTDNVAASAAAGAFIVGAIGEGKVLNLQGDMANQTAQARNEGLHQVLDAEAGIQVIDQSAMWNQDQGLAITENILTSDPDLKAIFGANDDAALGAVQAVKAAGRTDIVIVGLDGNPPALEAVKAGDLAADIAQYPDRMGTYGVDLMVRHLNGEDIPALVDTGTGVVTAENVDEFLP